MSRKLVLILIVSVFVLFTNCNSNGAPSILEPKTPEALRMELLQHERSNPLQYLSVEAKMKDSMIQTRAEGFFHKAEYAKDGNLIKGVIRNSASVAKFKDVVLTVSYYSATDTEVKMEDFVFYEFYEPNTTKAFSLHVHPPDVMKSFGVHVKGATPLP